MSTRSVLMKFSLLVIFFILSCTKESNEIKIGVYGPFTGGSAPMGISMRNGVQIAIEEINAGGGVLGKKLVMIDRDDETNNERGSHIIQNFLNKEHVVAVLGPVNTEVANASTQYSQQKKVPHIINVSAGARVNELFKDHPENYVFRIAASDSIQARVVVYAAIKQGARRPAILSDDTDYGKSGREKLEATLVDAGIKPVYVGTFKIGDTDMSSQLQAARAAGADVLLLWGIGPELAAVSNSINKIKWKVGTIGSWTLSMSNYINNAGKNGNGTMMPQTFIESAATSPKQLSFVKTYAAKYKESPISSSVSAAQGYDSVYLLKLAIEQAGSTEGKKIKDALENLNTAYEGLTGSYIKPFSGSNHEAVRESNVMIGMVKDGKIIASDKK